MRGGVHLCQPHFFAPLREACGAVKPGNVDEHGIGVGRGLQRFLHGCPVRGFEIAEV